MMVCVEKLFILGETKDLSLNVPICKNRAFGAHLVWVHTGEGKSYYGCYQIIGDVWEWTSSESMGPYPGFKPKFSEYTDKWAINQKVLRGGCFATPATQIRNTYRNYFKPHERIPFSGFRCAKDI